MMDRAAATRLLRLHFSEESKRHGLRGMLGAASFREVYERLIPAQKRALEEQSGSRFEALMGEGSIISVGYSYPDSIIDNIALKAGEGFDKDAWNIYSRWYDRLNAALNATAEAIAREIHGIPIPATLSGIVADIEHVHDYFGLVAFVQPVPPLEHGVLRRGFEEADLFHRFPDDLGRLLVAFALELSGYSAGEEIFEIGHYIR